MNRLFHVNDYMQSQQIKIMLMIICRVDRILFIFQLHLSAEIIIIYCLHVHFIKNLANVAYNNYIESYGPSLSWTEFAMGRVCHGQSLLWAELSRNLRFKQSDISFNINYIFFYHIRYLIC